jgi:hypothetical protein
VEIEFPHIFFFALGILLGVLTLLLWYLGKPSDEKKLEWRAGMCWMSGTTLYALLGTLLSASILEPGDYGPLLNSVYGIFAFVCGVIGFRASNQGSKNRRRFKGILVFSLLVLASVILPLAWK